MSTDLTVPNSLSDLKRIDLDGLKAAELGLNLLLLKIAQREASRIEKMSTFVDKIEEVIFDPTIIDHLSPQDQIQRYQLAIQSTKGSSDYIKAAVTSINWSDIETRMLILDQKSSDPTDSSKDPISSSDLQAAALGLLQRLSK